MIKKILLAAATLILVCTLAYYNAVRINTKQLRIREEILYSDKISEDSSGFLIAAFSDLYYGSYIGQDFLQNTVETINSFQPDLIVFAGDLIDQSAFPEEEDRIFLIQQLSSLKARYGKFAVLGDQDHIRKEEIENLLLVSGFTVLDNSSDLISINRSTYLNIVGIDSLNGGSPDVTSAFSGINANYFSFVLSHCPDIFDSVLGYSADCLFAGHSRGGQIYIPVISDIGKEYGCRKYFRGKYTKNNVTLDISNGVGRCSKNARLNADAEIVFYTLKQK